MTLTKEELETWLPTHCPAWCDGEHKERLLEGCGPDASREHRSGAGGHFCAELRNGSTGHVHRAGSSGWDMDIRQQVFTEPLGAHGELFINLTVKKSEPGQDRQVMWVHLTTGEARVLAAQLLRAADRMDLT